MNTSQKLRRNERIEVEVPDICTTSACRHLVEEIIKFVLENKRILPYPITHLSTIINPSTATSCCIQERDVISEQLHIRKAHVFYSKLLYIFQGLKLELNDENWKKVKMIALLLGPTINCPKEVYLIKIPDLFCESDSRMEKNDMMRYVVLNNDMMNFIGKFVPRNNMFVLLLKPEGDDASWLCPLTNYKILKRVPIALLKLAPCQNRLNKDIVLTRPKCTKVDYIIDRLCNMKLNDKDTRSGRRVVLHAKQVVSSSPGQSLSDKDLLNPSPSNNPMEHSSPDTVENDSGESDSVAMKFYEENDELSQTVSESVCCNAMDRSTETSNENLMWYLCTEHLTSFKEPKRSFLREKKLKVF